MRKPKGFSLAGVIIATGIGAIIIGFISEMIIFQYKEQKNLSQKIEISDFANTLLSTFSKPSNCSCQFQNNVNNPNIANFAALHFDSTNITGTESISVANIYSGCSGGLNSPLLLASNNQPLYGARDLIVDNVKLINLRPSGGGSNPRDWQGQWQIQFKVGPGSLSKPSPPVLVTQKFTIDDTNPSIALISSCNGISTGTGTTNYLAKWSGLSGMLMDSGIFEEPALKRVGIGTVTPEDALEVVEGAGRGITATRYGQVGFRGGAVQVRGSRGTQAVPSAVQAGDYLGWFYGSGYNGVGFTNHALPTSMTIQSTETWDAASNGGKLVFKTIPNGTTASIDRMVINHNGLIGIGTPVPSANLDVANQSGYNVIQSTVYSNTPGHNGQFIGRRARGTPALPTSPLAGDFISEFAGFGSPSDGGWAGMRITAAENLSAAAGGMDISFHTAPLGTIVPLERMRITNAGKIGVGTSTPAYELDVHQGQISGSIDNGWQIFLSKTFSNLWNHHATFIGLRGSGTESAPGYPRAGDSLAGFMGRDAIDGLAVVPGYGGGAIYFEAAENFSAASKGTQIHILTTGLGQNTTTDRVLISANGNVGIGNMAPTKLLHVGNSAVGSGLAVANFENIDGICTITPASFGSGIACSSDESLKENFQNVTGSYALNRILRLQAVTYNFKTSPPENRRTGYMAKEVQKIAPEFVRKNDDGLLQIYYDAFIPWITEAIKTLYNDLSLVKSDKENLREKNKELETRLASYVSQQQSLQVKVSELSSEIIELKTYICIKEPQANLCRNQ